MYLALTEPFEFTFAELYPFAAATLFSRARSDLAPSSNLLVSVLQLLETIQFECSFSFLFNRSNAFCT